MRTLEWAFEESIIQQPWMPSLIEDSYTNIYAFTHNQVLVTENPERPYVELLALDVTPFIYTKALGFDFHERPKEDESRMLFQTLFLLVLREQIPHKCK